MENRPTGTLRPESFVEGSRDQLERITEKLVSTFKNTLPNIAAEWIDFRDNIAPQSDDVDEWCSRNELHVPFYDILFGNGKVQCTTANVSARQQAVGRRSTPLDSVQWSRKNRPRHPPGHPVNKASYMRLDVDQNGDNDNVNESSVESDSTEVNSEDEWATCRRSHHVHGFGNPSCYVGRSFTVPTQFLKKASFASKCPYGKILAVVRRKGDSDLYYKFYNHRNNVSHSSEELHDHDYCYVKCKQFMSTSEKTRMMRWEPLPRTAPRKKRPRRETWRYSNIYTLHFFF